MQSLSGIMYYCTHDSCLDLIYKLTQTNRFGLIMWVKQMKNEYKVKVNGMDIDKGDVWYKN